jgi:hypothetical protein
MIRGFGRGVGGREYDVEQSEGEGWEEIYQDITFFGQCGHDL